MNKNTTPREETKPAYMLFSHFVQGNQKPELEPGWTAFPDFVTEPEKATGWNVFRPCSQQEKIRLDEERSNGYRLLTTILQEASTEDLDYIYDKLSRRCPLGKKQLGEVERLQAENQQLVSLSDEYCKSKVKAAVTNVLRQVRQVVPMLTEETSSNHLLYAAMTARQTAIVSLNESVDAIAKQYDVTLGAWPV